jgi:selenide,water dikinase
MEEPVRLTAYSHGAGCGCKIAPAQLDEILRSAARVDADPRLLVGHETRDDAAVMDLGNGQCLVSTTDFFSPIVDDPGDFGRIAAANALSDVYAMGGTPLMAVAILGWPVEKLGTAVANRVVEGGRETCQEAGIPLAGGHSIDAPEPFFGLAVTGLVRRDGIKRNNTAQPGDALYLTKPLGTGILSTAMKRGVLRPEHQHVGRDLMVRLNRSGSQLAERDWVHALTDVTGFGAGGHLIEMCDGGRLSVELDFNAVPIIPEALAYLALGCYPDGAFRNWRSIGPLTTGAGAMDRMMVLSDPQTNGGLLIACDPAHSAELEALLRTAALPIHRIGTFTANSGSAHLVHVH